MRRNFIVSSFVLTALIAATGVHAGGQVVGRGGRVDAMGMSHGVLAMGGSSPAARADHAMAYDGARGRAVLFGGCGSAGCPSADTWEWDGSNWIERRPVTSPPARSNHAMAYDSARGRVVLFGGIGYSGALADTWEWDGSNWIESTPATSPAPRIEHAMAYDSTRSYVVLFGGSDGLYGGPLADTWEWDGTAWVERAAARVPTARGRHALAYDTARKRMVLFGGGNWSYQLSDTWEWDGSAWIEIAPVASPANRVGHAMTYDAARGHVVLFGGYTSAGACGHALADTWEWDGTDWVERTPDRKPPLRYEHVMAYDGERGAVVLFGGYGGGRLADTWAWDGTTWVKQALEPFGAFFNDAAGFEAAAGSPPVAIGFDDIPPGTDITGTSIVGATFNAWSQPGPSAPLIAVRGIDTFTPDGFGGVIDPATNKLFPTSGENVLSPGGVELAPGFNPWLENDDLEVRFDPPVSAVGFDLLFQELDEGSWTGITVFGTSGEVLYANGSIPTAFPGCGAGAPGGPLFVGVVSPAQNIARLVVDEFDDNSVFPDANIGFDSFRVSPLLAPLGPPDGTTYTRSGPAPTFTWRSTPGYTHQVEFSNSLDFEHPALFTLPAQPLHETSYTPNFGNWTAIGNLAKNRGGSGTIYWRVVGYGDDGEAQRSAARSFVFQAEAPAAVAETGVGLTSRAPGDANLTPQTPQVGATLLLLGKDKAGGNVQLFWSGGDVPYTIRRWNNLVGGGTPAREWVVNMNNDDDPVLYDGINESWRVD